MEPVCFPRRCSSFGLSGRNRVKGKNVIPIKKEAKMKMAEMLPFKCMNLLKGETRMRYYRLV